MSSYLKLLECSVNFTEEPTKQFVEDVKNEVRKQYKESFYCLAWRKAFEEAETLKDILNVLDLDLSESGEILTAFEEIYNTPAITTVLKALCVLASNDGEIIFKNLSYCQLMTFKYREKAVDYQVIEL